MMRPVTPYTPSLLVLFDFDGTLTHGDTLWRFLLFAKGWPGLLAGIPGLALRVVRLLFQGALSAETGKAAVLHQYFGGRSRKELEDTGERFCIAALPRCLRPERMDWLRSFRDQGAQVLIVSASLDIWLRPFCKKEGIGLICTEAAFSEAGLFEGAFSTPNCKGEEKVERIKQALDLSQFSRIIAYGDTPADLPMLSLADEAVYLGPPTRARRAG